MTDLKALARELLEEAQHSLQAEGHLTPTAVVITPKENLIFDLEFESDDERDELYAEMVEAAQAENASAIITVNDVYLGDADAPVKLEGEGWGALAAAPSEAIVVTVSGSGFQTWSLMGLYYRRDEQFVFEPPREMLNPAGEVDLLGDWTRKTGTA